MKSKSAIFFLFVTFFLLLASIAYSQYYQDYLDDDTSDSSYSSEYANETRIPDWYEVSDEEVEFCQTFAGTSTAEDVYESAESELVAPVSKLTLALQGEYTTLSDKRIYEIAWYVQPLSEDISYTIYLVDEQGDTEEVTTGYSQATTGDAGYEAIETDAIYSSAEIVLVEDGTVALKVPFVEK